MSSKTDKEKTEDQNQAVLSKRKKQLDNMKDASPSHSRKRPHVEWSQSVEDLKMSLKLEGIKGEQLRNIDIRFTDTDVTIKLMDGRHWTWGFSGEIFREFSRVKVKKQKITIHMKKKVAKEWSSLEVERITEMLPAKTSEIIDLTSASDFNSVPVSSETSTPSGSPAHVTSQTETAGSTEPAPAQSLSAGSQVPSQSVSTGSQMSSESEGAGSQAPLSSQGVTDLASQSAEGAMQDEKHTKEESVYELKHLKHDYIEKDETFTVHVYVKEVKTDSVKIDFDKRQFVMKFQTSDTKFLSLHEGTARDTVFYWTIQLRGEIIPEKSKYKITTALIELTLAKKVVSRWVDMEALQRKDAAVTSKSDSWITLNQVKAREPLATSSVSSKTLAEKAQVKKKVETDERESDDRFASPAGASYSSTNKENLAQQKPTCKVQPLNKNAETSELVVSPGFTGLDNLGNTCFMNGVLQCLVNSREFRDFFLDSSFKQDLNTDNPLGSGGRLAVAFAVLMKILWAGKHYSYATSKLKSLVAQKASQFTGFAQHDAQEFMAFLLDGLHEDLNRIKKKPYTETVEDGGRADELVAAEAWAIHKKRNDSFVVDLFQGQYKSKLVCPVCGKLSITFDPFLYLSLPLPKRQRLLPVTFMWRDPYRKPVRYMLKLSKDATVEALKDGLQRKTGVDPKHIRVFEAYKGRIHKIFGRGSDLSVVQASDVIIANEVLSEEVAGEPVYEIAVVQRTLMPNQFPSRCAACRKLCPEGAKLKRCTKCFKAGYCDHSCQKNHWQMHRTNCKPTPEPVGCPFILSLPESRATFSRICQLMEAYARYSVDTFQPPVKTDGPCTLSSKPSSSNLSNSSQSSGSQNSLDSQSSFSSSCTITADQEEPLEDDDVSDSCNQAGDDGSRSSSSVKTSTDSGISTLPSAGSAMSGAGGEWVPASMKSASSQDDMENVNQAQYSADPSDNRTVDMKTDASAQEENKSSTASGSDRSADGSQPMVNPVLGIQTSDTERSTPMFFIKPVNQEGQGLTGSDGERLEDKGDVTLDLTNRFFLSIDWKNNDKCHGYVLVQSKELEFENDASMMTASLEENSNVTLDQCLEMFTEPEVLSPEEAWYCPQCKEHREATKQLSTWKLPHTLIIQLKRFSFRNFIWRDKIDKMVEFPTRGLDLSSYYVGSRPTNEPPPVYDLYGVVNHHGGILGGHYTSFVRCADRTDPNKNEVGWRLCDDSRVSSISHEKNVVTRAAYLLFYRRRQVFIPPPNAGLTETQLGEEKQFLPVYKQEQELETKATSRETEGEEEEELPDLEIETENQGISRDCSGTQLDSSEDGEDLGYTDMDSVD